MAFTYVLETEQCVGMWCPAAAAALGTWNVTGHPTVKDFEELKWWVAYVPIVRCAILLPLHQEHGGVATDNLLPSLSIPKVFDTVW